MTIQNITALPTPPLRSDPTNFATRGDAFLGALPTFVTELNLAADQMEASQQTAEDAAAVALAASNNATLVTNTTAWVNGGTYTLGQTVFDPVDFDTYRNITGAAGGTTRPGLDPVIWKKLTNNVSNSTENLIINGRMELSVRATSFAAVADNAYTLDRWKIRRVSTGTFTVSQQSDAPPDNEFLNSLRVVPTVADASIAATEYFSVEQPIEGYNVRHLIGKPIVISFWVKSSKTGIHCVSLANGALDRSIVFEYTITAANTWEKKVISLSTGLITAGTWSWTNSTGLILRFALASGANFNNVTGSWLTGNYYATTNQVNCLDNTANVFAITGVQLEQASSATTFFHRTIKEEIELCQRYYEVLPSVGILAQLGASGAFYSSWVSFNTTKRVTPGILPGAATENVNVATTDYTSISVTGFRYQATTTTSGVSYITRRLDISAEL